MRYFFLQDYQHWLLAVFLGIILAVLVYLAFRSHDHSNERGDGKAGERVDYPDGIVGVNRPTPPFILFLYVGFAVCAIIYFIYIGVMGGPI